jgi:hypothetical protein
MKAKVALEPPLLEQGEVPTNPEVAYLGEQSFLRQVGSLGKILDASHFIGGLLQETRLTPEGFYDAIMGLRTVSKIGVKAGVQHPVAETMREGQLPFSLGVQANDKVLPILTPLPGATPEALHHHVLVGDDTHQGVLKPSQRVIRQTLETLTRAARSEAVHIEHTNDTGSILGFRWIQSMLANVGYNPTIVQPQQVEEFERLVRVVEQRQGWTA